MVNWLKKFWRESKGFREPFIIGYPIGAIAGAIIVPVKITMGLVLFHLLAALIIFILLGVLRITVLRWVDKSWGNS